MEIVVVGVRGFGKVHLRSLKGVDVSIVERDESVVKDVTSTYRIKNVYTSYEEALKSDAEIIDLAVPHNLHRDFAIRAFEKGKHVIIEKPIAPTEEEAKEMIRSAKSHGLKLNVAEQYHFDPSLNRAASLIKEGAIGRVQTIIVRDQRIYDKSGWRAKSESMGGGALIDGGIHYVHTMLMLGGKYSNLISRVSKGGSSLEGEDNSVSLFDFNNGSNGILYYSWTYRNPPAVPGFEIIGSEGSIYEIPGTRSQEDFKKPERRTAFGDIALNGVPLHVETYDVFEREMSEFIRSVKEDISEPLPPEMALEDLKTVLEIYNHSKRNLS
jgi:predicted dehydrogenase